MERIVNGLLFLIIVLLVGYLGMWVYSQYVISGLFSHLGS